jgi:oligopeptide transport system permease protein
MSPATLPSAVVTPAQLETGNSLWHDAWSRLRKNKLAVFGGATLIVLGLLCAFGPFFAQSYQDQNLDLGASAPSAAHWLGTDTLGRDLFARILFGVRSELLRLCLGGSLDLCYLRVSFSLNGLYSRIRFRLDLFTLCSLFLLHRLLRLLGLRLQKCLLGNDLILNAHCEGVGEVDILDRG